MQRISEQEILSAVGSFYEAAQKATREAWIEVWRQLAVLFRSGLGGFTFYDTRNDRFSTLITDADMKVLARYQQDYEAESRIRRELAKLKAGERFNRSDHIPDDEFVVSEIYEGFYKPQNIFYFEYQVFLVRPGLQGAVSFSRPKTDKNFDEHELAAMRVLLPHLERAFQLYASLLDTGLESKVMAAAVNRIARNLIVTNRELELVFANQAARELLAANAGLSVDKHGCLKAATAADTKVLAARVAQICELDGDSPGEAIRLNRRGERLPLEVLIAPFENDDFRTFTEHPLALMFVTDPEQTAEAGDGVLMQMYGMTPAEARFAALLAEHDDMRTVCSLLGIQESTGRTHLKRVYSKTGTNRQSALVKLILGGPASIH